MREWVSPRGDTIMGTLERSSHRADISDITDDGEPIYSGRTKVFWEDAYTATTPDLKQIFIDEMGGLWTFDQLYRVELLGLKLVAKRNGDQIVVDVSTPRKLYELIAEHGMHEREAVESPSLPGNMHAVLLLHANHLSEATQDWLTEVSRTNAYFVGKLPQGWFVYADEEASGFYFPNDLIACFMTARSRGAEYILFDLDGGEPVLPDPPFPEAA